jgi:molecular chaperone HscB
VVIKKPMFDNYFTLFGLSQQFAQNPEIIQSRYYQLQKSMHPDQLLHESQQAQAMALTYAAKISEAYHILKEPFSRAKYLLTQQGKFWVDDMSVKPNLPIDLLMEQMALREELDGLLSSYNPHSPEWINFKAKIADTLSRLLQQLSKIDNPDTSEGELKALFQQIPFYMRIKSAIDNQENQ